MSPAESQPQATDRDKPGRPHAHNQHPQQAHNHDAGPETNPAEHQKNFTPGGLTRAACMRPRRPILKHERERQGAGPAALGSARRRAVGIDVQMFVDDRKQVRALLVDPVECR